MATARTKSDALGYYASDPAGRGGIRSDFELLPLEAIVTNPIGPIIVQSISPPGGVGTGTIRAASTTTLAYTAPGDTEGTPVTATANTAVLLESGTPAKSVRVYRDSVYNSDVLGGNMSVTTMWQMNNVIAGPNADENGGHYYGCLYIKNHGAVDITSISIRPGILGSQRTSSGGQLSGSGAGTITASGSLSTWPLHGWVRIINAGTLREIVYYSSRTDTVLTVPASGRALLGTSAGAGAGTDTITPMAPITLWMETPTAGEVQVIADNTTAPSGATFSINETVATLAPGEERALWIHRHVPADAIVETDQLSGLEVSYTYDGTTYTNMQVRCYFRIGDTSLEGYELYVGDGIAPDFDSAPAATSSTIPFDYALPADSIYNLAVCYRNRYNLRSFNVLTTRKVIDAGGVDITDILTNPSSITMESKPGGEVDLTMTYLGSTDTTAADTWRLYITTDGSTPDPGTDTPVDHTMQSTGLGLNDVTQTIQLGPYAYGTVVKVIARTYSSTLVDESNSLTVTTETVDTQDPIQAHWFGITTGAYRGHSRSPYEKTTYYNSPTNTVGIEIRNGELVAFGTSEAFRGVYGNGLEFRTKFSFANVTHSTSGTASPIEVIDANTFYINVNGTRRAKVDISGEVIEADSFTFGNTPIALPVIGPTYNTATETYLMILNGVTGRWTPIVKVDSTGRLTTTAAVLQES